MNTPLYSDLDLLTQQINNPALLIFTESLTFMQTKQSCFLNNPFPCITNCVGPPALWFSKGQSAQLSYTYNSCYLKKNSLQMGTDRPRQVFYICIFVQNFFLSLCSCQNSYLGVIKQLPFQLFTRFMPSFNHSTHLLCTTNFQALCCV